MKTEYLTPHLFLYGSLLTGTPDRRLNKQMRRLLHRAPVAMIQARLYNLGRYPGVVPTIIATENVYGRVITLNNPLLLRRLDRYEEAVGAKCEFVRTMQVARLLPSRKHINCWVYLYNRPIEGKQRIISCDYVRFIRARRKW